MTWYIYYSHTLITKRNVIKNRIVRAMLNVDQTKRPLTKDLIRIPKVQLYIRESEIEKVYMLFTMLIIMNFSLTGKLS